MALIRTSEEANVKNYGSFRETNILTPEEWNYSNDNVRDMQDSWKQRYEYEALLISKFCKDSNHSKILELGSGPGQLGHLVLEKNPTFSYSFIDKNGAKLEFERRGYKGTFYVKDMMNGLDIDGLDTDYDFVVANDFLEHIANPSDVLFKVRSITKDNAQFFISVPNWRMGHGFIYRGLFDFDNWLYCCHVHGWKAEAVVESPLKCKHYPKLSSEETLPDNLITSWNWYFIFRKIL